MNYTPVFHSKRRVKKLQPLSLPHRMFTILVRSFSFLFTLELGFKNIKHVAGSFKYAQDISHWASSSTQIAACSFEPGTVADVGIAVRMFLLG